MERDDRSHWRLVPVQIAPRLAEPRYHLAIQLDWLATAKYKDTEVQFTWTGLWCIARVANLAKENNTQPQSHG